MQGFRSFFLKCKPFLIPFAISLASHITLFLNFHYISNQYIPKQYFPITADEEAVEVSIYTRSKSGVQSLNQQDFDNNEKKEEVKVDEGIEKKRTKNIKKNLSKSKTESLRTNQSALAEKSEGNENIDSEVDTVASASYVPKPKYPKVSIRNKQEGTVEIIVLIDENGKVLDYSIFNSSGYAKLDEAAMKVIPNARFAPAIKGGKEIRSSVKLQFHFDIKNAF